MNRLLQVPSVEKALRLDTDPPWIDSEVARALRFAGCPAAMAAALESQGYIVQTPAEAEVAAAIRWREDRIDRAQSRAVYAGDCRKADDAVEAWLADAREAAWDVADAAAAVAGAQTPEGRAAWAMAQEDAEAGEEAALREAGWAREDGTAGYFEMGAEVSATGNG